MTAPDLHSYDFILVAFSGGKDSTALVLWLKENGAPMDRVELHHHLVDGREGSTLMDWPITESYCQAFAKAMGLPIYFSWKMHGFEGELMRNNEPTERMLWESPDLYLSFRAAGGNGQNGTRGKFPQVTANLSQRWCSAYLKIDPMRRMIANDPRYRGKRLLVLSGERAEESAARSCYNVFENDASDNRDGARNTRLVDRFRPTHKWTEKEVWDIIRRHCVRVHPCYYMGWSRCSCRGCIFGGCNQFRSLQAVDPRGFERLVELEELSGKTIKRRESLTQLVSKGTPYDAITDDIARLAMATEYNLEIIIPSDAWVLPAGAYGDSAGPS